MPQQQNNQLVNTQEYKNLLQELKDILAQGHYAAYKAVDNIRVQTYWQMGERIVREELKYKDRADYGEYLIKNLSKDLNLHRRRLYEIVKFYRVYPIVRTLSAQLSWSHYVERNRKEMTSMTLPEDIRDILKKRTAELEEEQNRIREEVIPQAQTTFAFLSEIAQEPEVLQYLKAGGSIGIKVKPENEGDKITLWWDSSKKQVIISRTALGPLDDKIIQSNPAIAKILAILTPEVILERIRQALM